MARAALVNLGEGLAARAVPGTGDLAFWIHAYTLDSTSWVELWDGLAPWPHVGVDLPGHGSSLPLDADEDLPTLARRIGALAIAREARHLVAHSLGSIVGLQVALEYPDAFATLTLGAPILGGGPFEADIWMRHEKLKELFSQRGYGPWLGDYWMASEASLFQGVGSRPRLRQHLRKQVGKHPWWELADDSYRRLWHTPQAFKDLRNIGVPTLILVGCQDRATVRQCAGFLERLLPACERRELPDVGHLCLLEDPARVRPVIAQHWRAHPAPPEPTTRRNHEHAAHD